MHDSGHLKNIGSLNYTDLPNVDTCTTQYKKITFLSFQGFKNSNFCLKTQILPQGNKCYQWFSLKQQAHFLHFLRKRMPHSLNSQSIVLSSKNGSREEERLVQLRLKQLQNYFGMQK